MRLAFHTFALLREPHLATEISTSFFDANGPVVEEARHSPGFIAIASRANVAHLGVGADFGVWGTFALARFYDGGFEPGSFTYATSLSLWTGIAEVRAFSYGGLHKAALARRTYWFRKGDWPAYVMWWVPNDTHPTWSEASAKLEHLYDHGPSPSAFSFRHSYDSTGNKLG
jgi:hypothetical protein